MVHAFLEDRAPDAYERVIDTLLASPHFGERWARHWMDLVRYAESKGHEFDFHRPRGLAIPRLSDSGVSMRTYPTTCF